MEILSQAITARLALVFFFYGLSFTAMGLILLAQPKDGSSFVISESLWLLGWFGVVHGANEFLDMWTLIRRPESPGFELVKLAVLLTSYLFLFEFGRRAAAALRAEKGLPGPAGSSSWKLFLPALVCLTLALAAVSPDFIKNVPLLSRLLIGFPGAVLTGLGFLGYSRYRRAALIRLDAKAYFELTSYAFLAYGVLSGLITPPGDFFPSSLLNTETFLAATGLPVQIFRALCAVLACWGVIGGMRIFREGALQAAQQELLDIIEFFPDATLVIDGGGKAIAWNRAMEHMTGIAKKEMVGKGGFAYAAPFLGKPAPMLIDVIGGHAEAEKAYDYVYRRPDGTICAESFAPLLYGGAGAHIWLTASPLLDNDGNVYGAIQSIHDISDRRLAEKAVKDAEELNRLILMAAGDGIIGVDTAGRVLFANETARAMLGWTFEELKGRELHPLIHHTRPDGSGYPVEECPMHAAFTGGLAARIDDEMLWRRDGSRFHVGYSARPMMKDGRTEGAVITFRDTSDIMRAQEALCESEERYRTLINTAQVGIVVHQMGLIKFANRKMAELLRVKEPFSLLGRNLSDLISSPPGGLKGEEIRATLAAFSPASPTEAEFATHDGVMLDVEIRSVPITYQGSACTMAIMLDVTARKRAEREALAANRKLLQANAELEKRVKERTEQLEELNKELEAFSYSAAHDLKAPLRRMRVFAELLGQDAGPSLGDEPKKHLLAINKAAAQMSALVDGLLTLSTAGKTEMSPQEVPLSALLEEVMGEIRAENPSRAMKWTAAELPAARCDRAMIRQVLMNLLGNAVKYSRGRERTEITVLYRLENGFHVTGVRDNGVGFNMEHADRLFNVFQRLHRSQEFEGSGIGLSTVRRIISRHGGRVWAESEPDKGSTFWFSLPAASP